MMSNIDEELDKIRLNIPESKLNYKEIYNKSQICIKRKNSIAIIIAVPIIVVVMIIVSFRLLSTNKTKNKYSNDTSMETDNQTITFDNNAFNDIDTISPNIDVTLNDFSVSFDEKCRKVIIQDGIYYEDSSITESSNIEIIDIQKNLISQTNKIIINIESDYSITELYIFKLFGIINENGKEIYKPIKKSIDRVKYVVEVESSEMLKYNIIYIEVEIILLTENNKGWIYNYSAKLNLK